MLGEEKKFTANASKIVSKSKTDPQKLLWKKVFFEQTVESSLIPIYLVGGFSPVTQLKNISQNGNLPQTGVKNQNIRNHHQTIYAIPLFTDTFLKDSLYQQ